MSEQQPKHVESDISIKQLVLLIKDVLQYVRQKWRVIAAMAAVFGLLGFLYYLNSKPRYTAHASFTLTSSSGSSPMTSALSMAGAFGLPTSSVGMSNELMVGMAQSRRVIKKAFLRKAEVDGKIDLLANHYIDRYGWKREWQEDEQLANFRFASTDLNNLNPIEDSVLALFYDDIVDKHLYVANTPEIGMVVLEFSSKLEDFSKAFCKYIVDETGNYFINRETAQQRKTYRVSQARKDSLFKALKLAELELAQWQDSKKRIYRAEGHLKELELTRNVSILNALYSSSATGFEMAKFELLRSTPVLIVVDDPEFSISVSETELFTSLFVGLLLGAFMATSALVIWKFIRDASETAAEED